MDIIWMKRIFILLLCTATLFGYELKSEYEFETPIVTSKTLFPEMPQSFEILKIPADKTVYRIDAQVIAKTFELHNIAIDSNQTRFVTFIKASGNDYSFVKNQLNDLLQKRYPGIRIRSVSLHPRGYIGRVPANTEGHFDEKSLLSATGTFYILDSEGLRRYLDYTVDATLDVLHTRQNVSRREALSNANTVTKTILFNRFKDAPLLVMPEETLRFRSSLKADVILTQRQIEVTPLVSKNDKTIVEVRNDGVIVEFIATAIQEGRLYDIITLQKRDGKRIKGKVIGENRVELQ